MKFVGFWTGWKVLNRWNEHQTKRFFPLSLNQQSTGTRSSKELKVS